MREAQEMLKAQQQRTAKAAAAAAQEAAALESRLKVAGGCWCWPEALAGVGGERQV